MAVNVTSETFKKEVLESDIPVIVDFWAQWCRPCLMLAPELEALEADMAGKVKIVKINVDEEGYLAQQFRVSSIPTVYLFENGQVKNQVIGLMRKDDLKNRLGL